MSWLYKIAEHSLFDPANRFISSALYSGHPPRVNDPSACAIHEVGPLPPGTYTIAPSITHPMLGPVAMYLQPDPTNQMFGRGGFYIHGDSLTSPGSASLGCIVAYRDIRVMVDASPDKVLIVTA